MSDGGVNDAAVGDAAVIRRPWVWAGAVVFLAALAVHRGTMDGGFVYDDHRFIGANASIQDGIPFISAFTDPATASHGEGIQHDIYRPLRTILFAFEYQLFGLDATWWHLISVLLHAANAVLVLRLLRPLMRGALLPSAAGALLFALHPVTSESVAWLSSQGDLLAMTLGLTALILLERRGTGRTIAGTVCFGLACLAKESALALPVILLLRDLALPRDVEDAPSPWRRATLARVGLGFGVVVLYFAMRMSVIQGLAQVDHPGGSLLATVRAMLASALWYAGAVLWPSGFSFSTRIDVPVRWTDPEVVAGLGLFLTVLLSGIWALRTKRYVLALALLGFLAMLGPVSNVVVPLKTFVADRFLYPGLVCVAIGLALLVRTLRGTAFHAAMTVLVCVFGVLGFLTVQRNASWVDDFALWSAVRRDRSTNIEAYQGLAFEYAKQKEVKLAERAYAPYLEANPLDGKSLRTLGDLFGELADSLRMTDRDFEATTSLPLRRKQARVAQLQLYRRALSVWDPPGGLVFGRGSETMRREMLVRWMRAAVELGDLRAAKFANDYAIDLDADGAYHHSDAQAVLENASWVRRRARVFLAWRAVESVMGRPIPAEHRPRIEADRAALLEDVGLDPAQRDQALLLPLADLYQALIDEAQASDVLATDPGLFLDRADILVLARRPQDVQATLRLGLRAHPGQPDMTRMLQQLTQPRRAPPRRPR